MTRIDRFERIYIFSAWAFAAVGTMYVAAGNYMGILEKLDFQSAYLDILFYILLAVVNVLKFFSVKKGYFNKEKIYLRYRYIELTLAAFFSSYVILDTWGFIISLYILIITSFCKGMKQGIRLSIYICSSHLVFRLIREFIFPMEVYGLSSHYFLRDRLPMYLYYYCALILFTILCGLISNEIIRKEEENRKLVSELNNKCTELEAAKDEIEASNTALVESNTKLGTSNAELFTLYQVSRTISSILDEKELLKNVNDIILGILGVDSSSIALYEKEKRRYEIAVTSIADEIELYELTRFVNSNLPADVMEGCTEASDAYAFSGVYYACEDDGMAYMPINIKTGIIGFIIMRHKNESYLSEEGVKLINTISQQVGIALDNVQLYRKMEETAILDALTGIYNRHYFNHKLKDVLHKDSKGLWPVSLAIFDIDCFKKINDTYGHLHGDAVLRELSGLVKGMLRTEDVFARYGGEEFVLMFINASMDEAEKILEWLRIKIAELVVEENGIKSSVTVSFGLSEFPGNAGSERELLEKADKALYKAKSSGRNCVRSCE